MRWQRVSGLPISINGAVPSADPGIVAHAFERRAIPLLWVRSDRLLPVGTGVLATIRHDVLLVTAAHVIDLARRFGDIAIPAHDGGIVRLEGACDIAVDAGADLAVVLLPSGRQTRRLLQSWGTVPAVTEWEPPVADEIVAVTGYPAARTRWMNGVLHAKPLTFFAKLMPNNGASHADTMLVFGRIGRRVDGLDVHTPELEGASGAIAWSLHHEAGAPAAGSEALWARPLGIQVSYCHGHYVRCRRWSEVLRLMGELLPHAPRGASRASARAA